MKTIITILVFFILSANTAFACYRPEPTPEVTVTPTETLVTPVASESATPTMNPTETPKSDGLSDGQHQAPDGLGCAVHECKAIMPSGAPMTGRAR